MNSPSNSFKQKFITSLPLLIISMLCVLSLSFVNNITKEKIISNKEKAALAIINDVIPLDYDNDLFADKIELVMPDGTRSTTVYRARLGNQPVAVGLMPVTTKGYNGNIDLLIGISYEGLLTGVKILQHNETEGFGEQAHQDKSNWLQKFNNFSLIKQKEQWAIKKDGGKFDQLSGATITSRSIINSVYKTLKFYTENRDIFIYTNSANFSNSQLEN